MAGAAEVDGLKGLLTDLVSTDCTDRRVRRWYKRTCRRIAPRRGHRPPRWEYSIPDSYNLNSCYTSLLGHRTNHRQILIGSIGGPSHRVGSLRTAVALGEGIGRRLPAEYTRSAHQSCADISHHRQVRGRNSLRIHRGARPRRDLHRRNTNSVPMRHNSSYVRHYRTHSLGTLVLNTGRWFHPRHMYCRRQKL